MKVVRVQVTQTPTENRSNEVTQINVNSTNSKSMAFIDLLFGYNLFANGFLIFSISFDYRESNLLKRIFQCCLLNGGFFGLSIILFEYVLLPIIRVFLSWMFTRNPGNGAIIGNYIVTFLSILFGMIWVMPLFILSKVVNSLWFQVSDISMDKMTNEESKKKLCTKIVIILGYCRFRLQISQGSAAIVCQHQCHHSRYVIFTASTNVVPDSEHGR